MTESKEFANRKELGVYQARYSRLFRETQQARQEGKDVSKADMELERIQGVVSILVEKKGFTIAGADLPTLKAEHEKLALSIEESKRRLKNLEAVISMVSELH